jgi:hypothetical protein
MRPNTSQVAVSALLGLWVLGAAAGVDGQTQPPGYLAPRTPEGKPSFNGIWQAVNAAHWDLEDHSARPGVPAGWGVVEGGEIPYQPWADAKRKENYANRETADPERRCFLPGVPRATYMPFPFQMVQTAQYIVFGYEYNHTTRSVPLDNSPHPGDQPSSWMGDSRGRWDGETLVIDVRNFNGETWLDRAGNFHSDALHVVERYTRTGPDHLHYEVTIEDPKVFTRPWKLSMPLYRRQEKAMQLLEYDCVAFVDEELRRGSAR